MTETSHDKPQVTGRRPGQGSDDRADLHHAGGAPLRRGDLGAARRRPANWKTGETIFEQRGVEFPDFWSVNASTIVTTKYFRGAVGTDAREWSLRQLIDRVVLTYAKAGREHGYFATDAGRRDLRARADLGAAAPGVLVQLAGLVQRRHVVARSRCRACQPYDALVSTPAGLVPIGELVERRRGRARRSTTHTASRRSSPSRRNGVKEVLRLHTKAGHTLDVTADHLVWKSTGEGTGRFVPAGTLQAGDQLEWHRVIVVRRGGDRVCATSPRPRWPAGCSPTASSGSTTGTNRSLTIEAMTVTDAELAWVTAALDRVLPGRAPPGARWSRPQDDDARLPADPALRQASRRRSSSRWGLRARGVDMEVPAQLCSPRRCRWWLPTCGASSRRRATSRPRERLDARRRGHDRASS